MSALNIPDPEFMQDEEIVMFDDAVGKFFKQHLPESRLKEWEENGQVDREFWHEAGQAGLLGVSVPEEYGGHGGDFRHDLVVVNQTAKAGASGFNASLHNCICVPYIVRYGTEEQKKRWLPKMVNGELVTAIAMSEPGVGSDLQSITTTALKDGNGYKVNGSKTFISNGQVANFVITVAKTDPNERAKGISLVCVETEEAEGFERGKKLDKIGLDSSDTSELFYDDVFVPGDNILGGEEGRGFAQLMGELGQERLIIAAGAILAIEKALDTTIEYVKGRKAFGQTIWDFQNTQFVLADLKARGMAAKVFVNDCIARHLKGELTLDAAAAAKLIATELQGETVDKCLQLHGGWGYINEYPIAKLFRDSRITRIFGGSNEIMKMLIARGM